MQKLTELCIGALLLFLVLHHVVSQKKRTLEVGLLSKERTKTLVTVSFQKYFFFMIQLFSSISEQCRKISLQHFYEHEESTFGFPLL